MGFIRVMLDLSKGLRFPDFLHVQLSGAVRFCFGVVHMASFSCSFATLWLERGPQRISVAPGTRSQHSPRLCHNDCNESQSRKQLQRHQPSFIDAKEHRHKGSRRLCARPDLHASITGLCSFKNIITWDIDCNPEIPQA